MAFYKPAGSLTECQDRPWTTLKISEDNHQRVYFGGVFLHWFSSTDFCSKWKLQVPENRLSDDAIILHLGATHTPRWTSQGRKGRPWSCRKFFSHFRFFGKKNCKPISELH